MKKIFIVLLMFIMIVNISIFAQEDENNFDFGILFGTVVIDGVTYQTFGFQPNFSIGKFSVGLDLYFEFDQDFNLRKTDDGKYAGWSSFEDYINKILYLQWDEKGSNLYAKLGMITDATLGHGFIMQNYTNGLFYPEVRRLGLNFNMDGALFDFPYFGFETFFDDLKDIDLFGTRIYVRPLLFLEIPIINQIKLGFSYVVDTDTNEDKDTPYATDNDGNSDNVSLYGIDFEMPVLNTPIISTMIYTDWAKIVGKGNGIQFGVSNTFIKIIGLGGIIYHYGDQFDGNYFDQMYDNPDVRSQKYNSLNSLTAKTGWKLFSFLNFGQEVFTTYAEMSGDFTSASNPDFIAYFGINEGLIPMVDFSFTLIRTNMTQFSDLWKWTGNDLLDCYMQLSLGFKPGSMTKVTITYERYYELNGSVIEPVTTSSFSTSIEF